MLDERKQVVGRDMIKVDRVRKGKIQRKKLKSAKPGFTVKDNHLVKIEPKEHRNRAIGAQRAVRKRAVKMAKTIKRRKRSLKRGNRQGFYK